LPLLTEAGIPVRYLHLQTAWQSPRAIGSLVRQWRAWRPDLVQSFLFHANTVSTVAARLAGVPRVVWGIRVADPNRRRQWIERRLAGRANRIVCVSREVARFMEQQTKLDPGKLVVISNGLDDDALKLAEPLPLAELGVPEGRRMLLCVGRLHAQKGFDWLLACADELLTALPQHDLVLVGEGPERAKLERLAAQTKVAERIHFAGFRGDVPRCLRAADVLLLTSRWEGLPNVLLEAMAQGRPVVAVQTEGVEELLGPLGAAQTAPADPVAFVRAVARMAGDASTCRELGERNRSRAHDEFSLAKTLALYSQLYGELAPR
jgi:glycosyltransferase involved in cell wall biosynthesis